MEKPATKAKQKWNAEHYSQVKISVVPEVASAFKAACASSGVSMAQKLSEYMVTYSQSAKKVGRSPDYATKRQRRAALKDIVEQLERIQVAQEQCRDSLPENFQETVAFENAEQCVSTLEEVIELLRSIY